MKVTPILCVLLYRETKNSCRLLAYQLHLGARAVSEHTRYVESSTSAIVVLINTACAGPKKRQERPTKGEEMGRVFSDRTFKAKPLTICPAWLRTLVKSALRAANKVVLYDVFTCLVPTSSPSLAPKQLLIQTQHLTQPRRTPTAQNIPVSIQRG